MERHSQHLATVATLLAGLALFASCESEPKAAHTAAPAVADSEVTTEAGVAGRVSEDVYIAQAIVVAVDVPTRRVTLKGPEGHEHTFTARPEIKNLPQLKVGDKVTATFARRMVVTVRADDAPPSEERSELFATEQPGERPGMLVAEESEKVARITAIDPTNRVAQLQFADGITKSVPIRPDIDLSKYKVGDNVVIRVTRALTVLVEAAP